MKRCGWPAMCLAVALATAIAPDARAAIDMFIKIGDIQGESTNAAHGGWIELESFSHGISAPSAAGAGGGRGAGKVTMEDLVLVKKIDKTTPLLNKACCRGEHLRKVQLECARPSDGRVFLVITYEDVLITGVSASGVAAGAATRPSETVKISFSRINWEFRPEDGSPTVHAGWDLTGGKAL